MSPPYCKFQNCAHRKGYSGCKFHLFPSKRSRCLKWLKVSKWTVSPTKIPAQVYLCSCHFIGKRGPTKVNPDPEAEDERVDDVGVSQHLTTPLDVDGRRPCEDLPKSVEQHDEVQCRIQGDVGMFNLSTNVDVARSIINEEYPNAVELHDEAQSKEPFDLGLPEDSIPSLQAEIMELKNELKSKNELIQNLTQEKEDLLGRLYNMGESLEKYCQIVKNLTQQQTSHTVEAELCRTGNETGQTSTSEVEPCLSANARGQVTNKFDNVQNEAENLPKFPLELTELMKTPEKWFDEAEETGNKLTTNSSGQSIGNDYRDLAIPFADESQESINNSQTAGPPNEDSIDQAAPIRKRWKSSRNLSEQPEGGGVRLNDVGIQCNRPPFSLEYCMKRLWKDPDDFRFYTGISQEAFDVLYELLGGYNVCSKLKYNFAPRTPTRERYSEHSPKEKLFITVVRLRRGLTLKDLKLCFHLSDRTLSTIFFTWIRHMSLVFKNIQQDIFVSVAKQAENPPDCYKPFPNLRAVSDCAEFYIQTPENIAQQSNTSSYKGSCTVNVLFATSVFGGLSFISEAVEGSMTDRKLFLKCGLIDLLNPGEAIMCDKGFDIESDLEAVGVELLIPAFLGRRQHFTARELLINKAIAGSRIHVKIFIKRVKDFRLIRYKIPNSLLDIASDMIRVCANVVNFGNSHIVWTH